jgi:hypothetical protein
MSKPAESEIDPKLLPVVRMNGGVRSKDADAMLAKLRKDRGDIAGRLAKIVPGYISGDASSASGAPVSGKEVVKLELGPDGQLRVAAPVGMAPTPAATAAPTTQSPAKSIFDFFKYQSVAPSGNYFQ